jgi:hypothetical protein
MTTATISELASIIATNTAKVNDYLSSKNLPSPSFDVNAPSTSLIPPEAEDIESARAAVIDATTKLHRLMLGPRDYLQSFTVRPLPPKPPSSSQSTLTPSPPA